MRAALFPAKFLKSTSYDCVNIMSHTIKLIVLAIMSHTDTKINLAIICHIATKMSHTKINLVHSHTKILIMPHTKKLIFIVHFLHSAVSVIKRRT